MADLIQIRRDTAANWSSANPILAQGELGAETDTSKVKIGDGSTAWSSLAYLIDAGDYASYADATANFTGTLQNGGSNVVVDADIGVTVQGYDATTLKSADIGVSVQAYDADTAKLDVAQTFSAKQTFVGNASNAAIEFKNAVEDGTVSATAATGTINYDILSQSVLYYTANATGNWTVNVRGDSDTTLSSLMDIGDSITFAFLVTQGGTAYYNTAFQVDGVAITPKWLSGEAPTEGNASSIDCYSYSVVKTGSSTFVVLAGQTQFA